MIHQQLPAALRERAQVGVERAEDLGHRAHARQVARDVELTPAVAGIVVLERQELEVEVHQPVARWQARSGVGERPVLLRRRRRLPGDPLRPAGGPAFVPRREAVRVDLAVRRLHAAVDLRDGRDLAWCQAAIGRGAAARQRRRVEPAAPRIAHESVFQAVGACRTPRGWPSTPVRSPPATETHPATPASADRRRRGPPASACRWRGGRR